ncbi:hypothetical protein Tco_0908724 [Tanacetum coccineum]|uniref:Transposase (Putative), gypsy type n=1 Tax=Tanacetum coccineum TaxID=301880 RepID=A0ABQ5CUG1_9ASTR
MLDFMFFANDLPPSAVMYFLRDASLLSWRRIAVKRFPKRSPTVDQVCTFPHPSFQMAKYVAKYSIMTQERVDSFSEAFYIPTGVHPTAPGRDKTIIQFPAGKVGVDSCAFPISVPLYTGGILEKDSAPLLIARQEETVRLLESHKASFRRYPECFLCQVGLSKYNHFDDNSYPAYEYSNGSDMGLLDFIQTADPRKVRAVEVQKGADQVMLLESTKDCFMPLVIPTVGGSSSAAAAEVPVPTEERQEDVAPEDAYLNLADPDEDAIMSDALPAKKLRTDHPSLASGTGGKTLASLEQIRPEGSHLLAREQPVAPSVVPPSQEGEDFVDLSAQWSFQILTIAESFGTLSAPVDTVAAAITSTRPATASKAVTDVGPSHPEESESSDDSFYEIPNVDPAIAKRWYVPKWNITNDSVLDDAFSCHTLVDRVAPPAFFSDLRTMSYDQLFTEFNVGAARQICLGSKVRSRTEHKLELKEKLRAKYVARGKLLEERDLEILELKSKLAEKETEAAEAVRLRDQVSSLSGEKSSLTAEVSVLNVTIAQKDHDISLLNSHATSLASGLEDAKVACTEAGDKIISLTSEQDRLISKVSSLHAGFQDFKKKMEVQKEEQAQELYNRVAELEVHVMDVSGCLEGEFYPTYLTTLAGRRWLLAHRVQLALLKCLKSSEYQGILGHALGRAVDFGMQAGLEVGHENGSAGRSLSVVDAYNPEAAKANYIDAVKALEDVDFPLVNLLKSKKDAGMDEVLDYFLLDGPAADLSEAVHLQPCLEQLTVPIHHAGDKTIVGETSLSFTLMNVHNRAEGAKKHVAALRKLMIDIVSDPLSSQTWVGEASTSAGPLFVEDYQEEDTDEALGSVVAMPQPKAPYL